MYTAKKRFPTTLYYSTVSISSMACYGVVAELWGLGACMEQAYPTMTLRFFPDVGGIVERSGIGHHGRVDNAVHVPDTTTTPV